MNIENIEALRFKLRMFEISISQENGATYIYCDNESMVKNSNFIESALNKKQTEVVYNFSRWNIAAQEYIVAYDARYNFLNSFTKRTRVAVQDFFFGEFPLDLLQMISITGDHYDSIPEIASGKIVWNCRSSNGSFLSLLCQGGTTAHTELIADVLVP